MRGYLLFSFFRIFFGIFWWSKSWLCTIAWGHSNSHSRVPFHPMFLPFLLKFPPKKINWNYQFHRKLKKKNTVIQPSLMDVPHRTHQRFPPWIPTAPLARRPVLWASMTLKATCSSGGTFRWFFGDGQRYRKYEPKMDWKRKNMTFSAIFFLGGRRRRRCCCEWCFCKDWYGGG